MEFEIPHATLDEWLTELKPYQRNAMAQLRCFSEPEQAAEKWITACGPQNIIPFGSARDTGPFWERFKTEFRKFLCDEESYVEEKKAIFTEGPVTKAVLIAAVSAAIGATIGYAAALLAPAAAVLLWTVGKMGRNAYCSGG